MNWKLDYLKSKYESLEAAAKRHSLASQIIVAVVIGAGLLLYATDAFSTVSIQSLFQAIGLGLLVLVLLKLWARIKKLSSQIAALEASVVGLDKENEALRVLKAYMEDLLTADMVAWSMLAAVA